MTVWVLLVEDNPDDRELLQSAWRATGLRVRLDTARDGVEALARLRDTRKLASEGAPLVVLLDLKMPRMSGFDVLKDLRDSGTLRHLPVVVLTSSNEPGDVERSYALGANGYVVKPVDVDTFHEVIATLGRFWAVTNEPPPENAVHAAG